MFYPFQKSLLPSSNSQPFSFNLTLFPLPLSLPLDLEAKPPNGADGYGPGQASSPTSDELPYWDRQRHFQTHDALRERRERAASGQQKSRSGLEEDSIGGSLVVNFLLVSAVIAVAMSVGAVGAWMGSLASKSSGSDRGRGKSVRLKENG